ncbi:hypothetical protein FPK29_03195 [Bifidobacterium polysaccharolyticum]|uniref:Uncharacterized protein n=1 Tax=Bifidobacterium asteroides TaxID=1684 RepID=A0A556RCS1_9BIFI|nr:hypothetical protein FPK29_03195 [Bifidobacterium polysaccharolyticum]
MTSLDFIQSLKRKNCHRSNLLERGDILKGRLHSADYRVLANTDAGYDQQAYSVDSSYDHGHMWQAHGSAGRVGKDRQGWQITSAIHLSTC